MSELKTFYVGIKGVVVDSESNKALLLLKEADPDGKSYWDLPGGRIDDNETIQDTLKRELKEEVNLDEQDIKVGQILNAFRLPRPLRDGLGLMLIYYKVETNSSEKIALSSEHIDHIWVSIDELDEIDGKNNAYIDSGYKEAVRLALKV